MLFYVAVFLAAFEGYFHQIFYKMPYVLNYLFTLFSEVCLENIFLTLFSYYILLEADLFFSLKTKHGKNNESI